MIEIKTPILKGILKDHLKIKQEILKLIKEGNGGFFYHKGEKINDNIHKLDWDNSTDFNREWVKLLTPYLRDALNSLVLKIGLSSVVFRDIWYQQYKYEGKHGWHTHGNNFTGVYYLDFDKENHPKTDILNPSNPTEKISIEAEEGDLITFPSYFIHRGGLNLSNTTKTIVSFNMDIETPIFDLVKE